VMYAQVDRGSSKLLTHGVERELRLALRAGPRVDRLLERELLHGTVALHQILAPDAHEPDRETVQVHVRHEVARHQIDLARDIRGAVERSRSAERREVAGPHLDGDRP